MRNWFIGAVVTGLLTSSLPASAAPVRGMVVENTSRWSEGHSVIVTESTVEASDGSRITIEQVGGSVGGIAMSRSHSLPLLALGDNVVGNAEPFISRTGVARARLREITQLRRAPTSSKDSEVMEFVRTENSSGAQIHWASGCALLSVDEAGSSHISGNTEFEVIDDVLAHWEASTRDCTDFSFVNEGTTTREVGFDGENVIKFREEQWCRPATKDDPQDCYDQAAAGITTLFFVDDDGSSRNGEILDADIEFNSVNFAFAVNGNSSSTAGCQADLANTLTHEVGHFLGLDHTCWLGGTRLENSNGQTVPSCASPGLSDDETEATMYNFQSCGETKKASLEADDAAGLCAIYPIGEHTTACEPADISKAGCCAVVAGGSNHTGSGALALLGGFGLLIAIRRRSQKTS